MQSTTLYRSIAGLRRIFMAAACCPLLAVAAAAQSEDGGRIEIPADQITCACASGGMGSITVIAEGSAGPFTFLWAGPGGYASTEQNPTDLPAPGWYTVAVTNVLPDTKSSLQSGGFCLPFQLVSYAGRTRRIVRARSGN